jgi:hypothetical protein
MDKGAGASAARNKIATFLREHGIPVKPSNYGRPPTNEDFLTSILAIVGERSGDERVALVIFHYWQSTYELLVPCSVIDQLPGSDRRHYLFSARTDDKYRPDRYRHDFYLGDNDRGEVVVHHEMRWRKASCFEDTTIFYLDE